MNPSQSNCHHPDLFMSCSRLAPTAKLGNSKPRATKVVIIPVESGSVPSKILSAIDPTVPIKKLNKKNHQYSDLEALPLKSAYFFKHVSTDCTNDILETPQHRIVLSKYRWSQKS